jgi:DNA polymerase delta subunit 2
MVVTGSIIAVMGTENSDGAFEVIDVKLPDLPRQPQRWETEDGESAIANAKSNKRRKSERPNAPTGGKVAIISGLCITGEEADNLRNELLMEYLLGDISGTEDREEVSHISRLIIAGDSIGKATVKPESDDVKTRKAVKKYGYDASAYNPAPTTHLDNFLATLLPSIPITLLPGETDPTSTALPQQPLHPAMLPRSRAYTNLPTDQEPSWFDTTTNPWEGDIDGWRFMGTGGQPVSDIFKYVEGDDRLEMMENILRWRIGAPTAPDTLCMIQLLLKLLTNCDRVLSLSGQRTFSD